MIQLEGPVIRGGKVLEEYDTPFRAYLRSKFEDQLMNNITPLLTQAFDVVTDRQQPGFTVDEFGGVQDVIPRPRVDAATAREKAAAAGVKVDIPESGMSEDVLSALIERKNRQKVINDALNRSPLGIRSAAGLGASLAAGLLDPLNVAAAFIPVVGEVRYSTMLAGASGVLGRTAVRAGVGAAEGAVGMAALEPATYAAHRALQDDYKAIDSLTNIAFGAGLGSLLHATVGGMAEAIKRPSTMEILQSGRTPVEFHLQSGQTPIDIHLQAGEAPLRIAPVDFTGEVRPAAQDLSMTLRGGKARQLTMEQAPAIQAAAAQAESTLKAITPLVRGDEFSLTKHIADLFGLGPREGLSYKILGFEGDRVQVARTGELPPGTKRTTSFKIGDLQERINAGEIAVNARTPVSAAISKGEIAPPERAGTFTMAPEELPFYSAKAVIERISPQTQATSLRVAVAQMAQGNVPDLEALVRTDQASGLPPTGIPDILATAQRQMSPDAVRIADADASAAGAERLKAAPKSHDVQAAEADLAKQMETLSERLVGKEVDRAELKTADETARQMEELAMAVKAASVCDL